MGASDYIIESGTARITLDPSLYNLEMAYATAYVFLDRAWVLFEGDPKQGIIVRLTPKNKNDNPETASLELARDFCNELVSITNYFNMLEKNRDTVNMILQRALFSASPAAAREAEEAEIDRIIQEVDKIAPRK